MVRAVFQTIAARIDAGQVDKLIKAFPEDLRTLCDEQFNVK
jgi:uncharacterized protein (DUF2267 family)